jgi:hypothetical protein
MCAIDREAGARALVDIGGGVHPVDHLHAVRVGGADQSVERGVLPPAELCHRGELGPVVRPPFAAVASIVAARVVGRDLRQSRSLAPGAVMQNVSARPQQAFARTSNLRSFTCAFGRGRQRSPQLLMFVTCLHGSGAASATLASKRRKIMRAGEADHVSRRAPRARRPASGSLKSTRSSVLN